MVTLSRLDLAIADKGVIEARMLVCKDPVEYSSHSECLYLITNIIKLLS